MARIIEKSGTGIEKSGTGVGKSGTGIEKSGTGIAHMAVMLAALMVTMLSGAAFASDARLALSTKNGHAIISVHGDDGVVVGVSSTPLDASGYVRVPLYSVLQAADNTFSMGLLVQGSGSGSDDESTGSDDAGTLVQGSGSGSDDESTEPDDAGTLVQGSGSGDAKESLGHGGRLMVQGSGSGDAGESCDGGPTLMVQGSGSGSSGESSGCAQPMNAWGIAEVVVDHSGAHVVIHQINGSQAEEYLVAFLPVSNSEVAHSLYRGSSNHGFVATP